MSDTDEMIKWLLEQIDADERDALAEGHVNIDEGGYYSCPATRSEPSGDLEWGEENCDCGLAARRSRALAECVTKRRIIKYWADPMGQWTADQADAARAQKLHTIKLLALPYAHRPGFEEAWRP